MANPIPLLLFLLSSNCLIVTSQLETSSNPIEFIKQSCNTTLYPTLCFKCLSPYANSIKPPGQEKRLAQAALQVSLTRARSASSSISKLSRGSSPSREFQAVKDCFDTLGDSVDELSQSVKELNGLAQSPVLNNPSFSWHMSNVRTWVSAALTDDSTCLDGFSDQSINSDGNLKEEIKAKVNDVAQVTSIALAFVTNFADGYQGVATTSP